MSMNEARKRQIESNLAKLKDDIASARKWLAESEQAVKDATAKLAELRGTGFRDGKLQELERQLAEVNIDIENDKLPKVYWVGDMPSSEDYVLVKVTAKRITVRSRKHNRISNGEYQYNKDGSSISRYNKEKIDIARTFPNGF